VSLFDDLGGRHAIERIVEALYDALERDASLHRLFLSRRDGERARQKLFFEQLLGGEPRYTMSGHADSGMQRRHAHRVITALEAERWLRHFDAAMATADVATSVRERVLAVLRPPAARLVNPGVDIASFKAAVRLARRGDLERLSRSVAEQPLLLNQRGGDGATLLWHAARCGQLLTVRWLVERSRVLDVPGSDVHVVSVMVTPHCAAMRFGHGKVGDWLLTQGAVVNGFTAAYLGDVERLQEADPNEQTIEEELYPVTPLHYAVDGGRVEAARLLIERGAEVRSHSRRLLALASRSAEATQLLLEAGADATQAESLGPIARGDTSVARLLLERGMDIDRPIRGRETFLTHACRGDKGGSVLTVRTLLELGADPNVPNGSGRTPLETASRGRFTEIVDLLLRHGTRR
jgi:truncated hemoglobin YjbI/ankyrin repeat protein